MPKVKAALIGCGRIGFTLETDPLRNKPCTHWGGASKAGIKIGYACDINESQLKYFSEKTKIPKENLFTDYKELIRKVKPELIIIATWTESHSKIGVFAAKNGVRIIVCEKPIASNLNDAKKLISTCKKNKTRLLINHERRFDPRYQKVKSLLNKNIIGKIVSVNGFILTNGHSGNSNIINGGGPLLHDGTHLIDICGYFFGPIKTLKGKFYRNNRNIGFEDHALAWLTTEDNINITIEAGGNRKYFMFQLDIYGTTGKITIGNGYQNLYIAKKSKYYTGFYDLEQKSFPKIKTGNCFNNIYKLVKKLFKNSDLDLPSSGEDGYNALEIIHSIYLSSSINKDITLPINHKRINLKKIFNL